MLVKNANRLFLTFIGPAGSRLPEGWGDIGLVISQACQNLRVIGNCPVAKPQRIILTRCFLGLSCRIIAKSFIGETKTNEGYSRRKGR